jgi:Ca-activated chloride channel family protein
VVVAVKGEHAQGGVVLTGNLGGTPWQQTIDLGQAQSAHGVEKLWARSKIASLDESRVQGANPAETDNAVLAVALSHHLASRLTSLVAVDVTPRRPESEDLTTARVPLNLPAGWDFDKVFGETRTLRERSAQAEAPAAILASLKISDAPPAAVQPSDAGLNLPQGGTDAELMLILGVLSLLAGFAMLRAQRTA